MNRSNCTQTSPYYWTVGALVLLALLLSGLNQSLLFDVDEGAFTEATREMLLSHDWGHTTLNGLDRFDKPIGVYWLQALSSTVFGINEFAFRLPSALAAWIASLALARFGTMGKSGCSGGCCCFCHQPWPLGNGQNCNSRCTLKLIFCPNFFRSLAGTFTPTRSVWSKSCALDCIGAFGQGACSTVTPDLYSGNLWDG